MTFTMIVLIILVILGVAGIIFILTKSEEFIGCEACGESDYRLCDCFKDEYNLWTTYELMVFLKALSVLDANEKYEDWIDKRDILLNLAREQDQDNSYIIIDPLEEDKDWFI